MIRGRGTNGGERELQGGLPDPGDPVRREGERRPRVVRPRGPVHGGYRRGRRDHPGGAGRIEPAGRFRTGGTDQGGGGGGGRADPRRRRDQPQGDAGDPVPQPGGGIPRGGRRHGDPVEGGGSQRGADLRIFPEGGEGDHHPHRPAGPPRLDGSPHVRAVDPADGERDPADRVHQAGGASDPRSGSPR